MPEFQGLTPLPLGGLAIMEIHFPLGITVGRLLALGGEDGKGRLQATAAQSWVGVQAGPSLPHLAKPQLDWGAGRGSAATKNNGPFTGTEFFSFFFCKHFCFCWPRNLPLN